MTLHDSLHDIGIDNERWVLTDAGRHALTRKQEKTLNTQRLIDDLRTEASHSPIANARVAMFEAALVIETAREVMQRLFSYGKQSLTDEELLFLGCFIAPSSGWEWDLEGLTNR